MKISSPPDSSKMKELILHVATVSAKDDNFGAVKLNKILFFSDFLAYLERGKSITGQDYFALPEGPAPQQLLPIREEMEKAGEIAIQKVELMGYPRPLTKIIALRPPDYLKLETHDIVITDKVIARLQGMNSRDVSDLAHKFAGWRAAIEKGEKSLIPYSSALLDPKGLWDVQTPRLPSRLVVYGKKLAAKFAA